MSADGSTQVGAERRPGSTINEENIRRLVHGFYAAVRDDDVIGPIFEREIAADAWPVHLAKMCDFWSSVLLKTDRYAGRPLAPHLRLSEVTDAHFGRWLVLFRRTARECFSPDSAAAVIALAERIAHSFRMAMAFHRGEDSVGVQPLPAE